MVSTGYGFFGARSREQRGSHVTPRCPCWCVRDALREDDERKARVGAIEHCFFKRVATELGRSDRKKLAKRRREGDEDTASLEF